MIADSADEPNFLVRKSFPALFEHVGVADVESIKHPIGIDPEGNILAFLTHMMYDILIMGIILLHK